MKTTGYGEAIGKVILMGEHAVVYGEPAFAIPLPNVGVRITIKSATFDAIDSDVYRGNLVESNPLTHPLKTMLDALRNALKIGPIQITVEGNIPVNAGLGSSAAVAGALVAACYDMAEENLDEDRHIEWIQVAEKVAHGNPSGIDATAIVKKRPVLFVKDQGSMTMRLNLPGYFIVGHSGLPGRTKRAVEKIAAQYDSENTQSHIRALGQLTNMVVSFDHTSNPAQFGSLMNEAHKRLQALGVTSKSLDNMVHGAIAKGALGAKMTGGGLGGSVIAYAKTQAVAEDVRDFFVQSTEAPAWVMKASVLS